MTDAGLHGIGIDEAYGGQGGGIVEQMIVAEELRSFPRRAHLGMGTD